MSLIYSIAAIGSETIFISVNTSNKNLKNWGSLK